MNKDAFCFVYANYQSCSSTLSLAQIARSLADGEIQLQLASFDRAPVCVPRARQNLCARDSKNTARARFRSPNLASVVFERPPSVDSLRLVALCESCDARRLIIDEKQAAAAVVTRGHARKIANVRAARFKRRGNLERLPLGQQSAAAVVIAAAAAATTAIVTLCARRWRVENMRRSVKMHRRRILTRERAR